MTTVAIPAGPYLDNVALLERALEHIEAGTTELGARTGRVPAWHYTDPAHLDRELALMRRRPIPFCPGALLAEPGSYHARTAAGVALVAVRTRDGEIRAYRNSCRHRGTALVDGSGCTRSFVCPFHGWVYALDGSLSHVPAAYGFDGAEVGRDLVPVACLEHAGLIWIDQDGPGDFAELAELPGLIGDQELIEEQRIPIAANWKLVTEGFLEGYHIKATHKTTFLPYGYDNITVLERHGRHSRITFPFQRIEALRDLPRDRWRIDGALTVVDHYFPNAILARLAAHAAFVVVEPVDPTHSRLAVYKVAQAPLDADARAIVKRDIDFVEIGLTEDRAMAESVQRGMAGNPGDVVFGRFEINLTHLHEGLAADLG